MPPFATLACPSRRRRERRQCSGCGPWPPAGELTLPTTKQSVGSAAGARTSGGFTRYCIAPNCIRRRASSSLGGGQAQRATGRTSTRSTSTPNKRRWSTLCSRSARGGRWLFDDAASSLTCMSLLHRASNDTHRTRALALTFDQHLYADAFGKTRDVRYQPNLASSGLERIERR